MHRTVIRKSNNLLRDIQLAKETRSILSNLPYDQRLGFLRALQGDVLQNKKFIMDANRIDCDAFAQQQHCAVSPRLSSSNNSSTQYSNEFKRKFHGIPHPPTPVVVHHELSPLRIRRLLVAIEGLMKLPDPIAPSSGELKITKGGYSSQPVSVRDISVPLGIVGVLSRFRPRLTLDAVAMCIQSGNAVLIDGGVSVSSTNKALMASVRRALAASGIPSAAVIFVEASETENDTTTKWLQASDSIDLGIVCGNEKLFKFASQRTAIPLIKASGRACSLYVDKSADYDTALKVVLNAKFQRPSATNAINTLIIHENYPRFQELLQALKSGGALLLGDEAAEKLASDCIDELASEEVYNGLTEGFLDFHRVLCVKTVRNLNSAMYFLELFGSKQSDGIIATDESVIDEYCRRVDSAVVLVNASTRLSSGCALGRGTDLAIATSKVHSRGPLTISALTTRKIVVRCEEPGGALRH